MDLGIIKNCAYMIAIDMILQGSLRNGPVSAYFTFETIEFPKLAFGNGSCFKYGSSFSYQI
jgi:hypothetical protein